MTLHDDNRDTVEEAANAGAVVAEQEAEAAADAVEPVGSGE